MSSDAPQPTTKQACPNCGIHLSKRQILNHQKPGGPCRNHISKKRREVWLEGEVAGCEGSWLPCASPSHRGESRSVQCPKGQALVADTSVGLDGCSCTALQGWLNCDWWGSRWSYIEMNHLLINDSVQGCQCLGGIKNFPQSPAINARPAVLE